MPSTTTTMDLLEQAKDYDPRLEQDGRHPGWYKETVFALGALSVVRVIYPETFVAKPYQPTFT